MTVGELMSSLREYPMDSKVIALVSLRDDVWDSEFIVERDDLHVGHEDTTVCILVKE